MSFNLNAYSREIAYAAMGVLGVLVLSVLFRRTPAGVPVPVMASAPPMVASAAARAQHQQSSATSAAVHREVLQGDVEGDPMDDEAHQLFRRVRDMVADNPDDAAKVLRGWIYED